jgi:peptidoglycan/xylan/chitin deacetylase (PgdA/CDA1 family)
VALTFDDGPDPESTGAILDILAAHRVPATFFCVGYRARQYPDLVRRIAAEGHAVGSHSETHRVTGLSASAALADFVAGHRSVEEAVGGPLALFRPPHGHLPWKAGRALRGGPWRTWLWTVDPKDYAPATTPASALRVLDTCAPGDVILMHDGLEEAEEGAPPRSLVAEVLPQALSAMKRRGLTFQAIDAGT